MTGKVCGLLGVGMTRSTFHDRFSVTMYRNRSAAVATVIELAASPLSFVR